MKNTLKALMIITFFLYISLTGCIPTTKQLCSATALIIDKSFFPEGTSQDEIISPVADEPINSAFRQLYLNHTGSAQFVLAYSTDKRTNNKYKDTLLDLFMVSRSSHSWKIPDFEFKDSSDESIYACGFLFDNYQCRWVSRYKNYLVDFGMDISPNGFSLDDFHNAILLIDKKMSSCIQ